MRKLFVFALAVVLAVAFAVPAMAFQVRMGARVDTDVGIMWHSGESYGANDMRMPDLTTFYIAQPISNYLRALFMSNDKSTGVDMQIRWATTIQTGGATNILLYHAYGWYKFGRCKLVIGHTDNLFASPAYAPYQWFGGAGGVNTVIAGAAGAPAVLFFGYGKQYSGRFAQITLYYGVGPWTFMIGLGQAGTNTTGGPGGIQSVFNTMYPRVDMVVKYKGKYFGVAPGLSIQWVGYEPMNGASLQDDRILTYMLVLPFRISITPAFRIKGEFSYGKNWPGTNYDLGIWAALGQGVYWGGNNDGGIRTKVEDTYLYAGCIGLEYLMGRMSFHAGFGWQMFTNDSNDQNNTWRHGQNVRWAANVAMKYHVNKHFTIAPEISYWSFGQNPFVDHGTNAGAQVVNASYGNLWMAGISFQFRF